MYNNVVGNGSKPFRPCSAERFGTVPYACTTNFCCYGTPRASRQINILANQRRMWYYNEQLVYDRAGLGAHYDLF